MITNQKQLTALGEGRSNVIYPDSEGYDTIGIGALVDKRKGARLPAVIEAELAKRDIDIFKGQPMPEDLIDQLFDIQFKSHNDELLRRAPWIGKLDEVRRAVLGDMAFNMGVDGLLEFKNTLRYVSQGRWLDAATAMMQSKWATQVGKRAVRLAVMMVTGLWPKE